MAYRARRAILAVFAAAFVYLAAALSGIAVAHAQPTPTPTPDMSQTFSATHFLHGDGQSQFDYLHGAPRVPMPVDVHTDTNSNWLAGIVAATDWSGDFIEAGWFTVFDGGYPDCAYPLVCAYSNNGVNGGINSVVMRNVRWTAGTRPWFRVSVKEQVDINTNRWGTWWAYHGDWNDLHPGVSFPATSLDWIAVGLEAVPWYPDDSVYLSAGIFFDGQAYSNTSFGATWNWSQHCTQSTIKPWCYTHILTNEQGCSGCGASQPHGQSFAEVGPCINGIEACTKRWSIRVQD
jgi:hypothetical protein